MAPQNTQSLNKIILLAEDEVFIRELYEGVLAKAGFTVISAIDGVDALEKIQKNVDLILLDIMMPRMNGIEVLKQLKVDPDFKNIPIVLLTNLGSEEVIKSAIELGIQGYMMKMRNDPYTIVQEVTKYCTDPTYRTGLTGFQK